MKYLKYILLVCLLSICFIQPVEAQTQKQFVSTIGKYAKKRYKKHKVLPSVITAMAIHESAYGTSNLAKKAHNLFGYKYVSTVYANAKKAKVKVTGTYKGYVKFKSNKHCVKYLMYIFAKGRNKAVVNKKTPQEMLKILRNNGYYTSSTYETKINYFISKHKLRQYDKK